MGACLLDLIPDVEEIFKKVSHMDFGAFQCLLSQKGAL